MTDCNLDSSVPDWVIEHPETLAVFEALGIDYSCGGKSLALACQQRSLNPIEVQIRLLKLIADHVANESRKASDPPHDRSGS